MTRSTGSQSKAVKMTVQLLPTYRRYVNGVPQPIGRKSLRLREKYIILLVFLTFGTVCFGAFFFLPDLRDRVAMIEVRRQLQIAGNDMFVPGVDQHIGQHGDVDIHKIEDQKRLDGKIEEERQKQKRLEDLSNKLNMQNDDTLKVKKEIDEAKEKLKEEEIRKEMEIKKEEEKKNIEVVHKEHEGGSDTRGGEPSDPSVKEKRNKIKEVFMIYAFWGVDQPPLWLAVYDKGHAL